MNPLRPQMNPLRPAPMPQTGTQIPPQGITGQTNGGPNGMLQRMIFNKMYNSNPQFRAFADQMRDKTPEQAFQEQGLDYNQFQNINPAQIKNMLGL